MIERVDVAIINRSFGPQGQVVGEALLRLSEHISKKNTVCVITQSDGNLKNFLKREGRAHAVQVLDRVSRTDSSSGLIIRVYEAFIFMWWTFFFLFWKRPRRVYVSTNPPVLVPFIVFLYCKILGARYVYHLQDIHPEAANIVIKVHPLLYRFLHWVDVLVVRNAHAVVTLSDEMKNYILQRSRTVLDVYIINNPAFSSEEFNVNKKREGVVFSGNAGRLQLMPLLIESIHDYLNEGGRLSFTFVGGGFFSPELDKLGQKFESFKYMGLVSAREASRVVSEHRWALLPINDEVTKYAFPSKTSSYVLSGCEILAICHDETSVGRWVRRWALGRVCVPSKERIISLFKELEGGGFEEKHCLSSVERRSELVNLLSMDRFVSRLAEIIALCDRVYDQTV